MTNHLPQFFIIASLLFLASSNLDEVGVLTVVNEDLGKSVLRSILSRFTDVITKKRFNLEKKDDNWTYILKNLRVTHYSTNTVDMDFRHPQLTTKVHVGGNIKVETDWMVKYNSWWMKTDTSGDAKVKLDRFNIYAQAEIGAKDGRFTVQHCPTCCDFQIGSFDISFSGFWSWLLNAAASIFESEIKGQLQKMVCESVNKVAQEAANELISCQKTIIHETINNNPVTIDNSPVYVLGNGKCASLGFRGLMSTNYTPPVPELMTPFYSAGASHKPTTESNYTLYQPTTKGEDKFTSKPTQTSTPPKKFRKSKRDVPGGCPTIPGHNIAVRIEERVIQNTVDTLHKMGFMDYKAVHRHQEGEETVQFNQYWNGQDIGLTPAGADIEKPALYSDHDISIAIKATESPTIYINSTGIIISTPLTTRVKIFKEATNGSTKGVAQGIKIEIPVVAVFVVTVMIRKVDQEYWIVPAVHISADIGDLKISNSFVRLFFENQIRRCVKNLIEQRMSRIVEKELSQGYPLAVPNILELDSPEIRYYKDYIELSANVERVHLDLS